MEKVTRTGVSLEPDLLRKFDKLVRERGYLSRSEAIRDLIRNAIVEQVLEDEYAESIGTLTIVYNHDTSSLVDKLLDYQHQYHSNIKSTTHIHLDEHNCLEVIIVGGRASEVREIADHITSIKGVKHGKLTITSIQPTR